jgi:predicted metal-dependent hydrolase
MELVKNNSPKKQSDITVRRIAFGHEKTMERHWFRGNPFMTHFMNSLHSVFPAGERYFVRSVKWFDKQVQNPRTQGAREGVYRAGNSAWHAAREVSREPG